MTEPALIGTDEVPLTPGLTPLQMWHSALSDLFDRFETTKPTRASNQRRVCLLNHADRLIRDCADSIWLSPDGERSEVPDRQTIGSHSDPTGDTAVNERRIDLNRAIHALVYDGRRSRMWADCLHTLNTNLTRNQLHPIQYNSLGHDQRRDLLGRWRGERHMMLEYCHRAPDRMAQLANVDPRRVVAMARQLHRANQHFEQKLRNAQTSFTRYHGDTT